MVYSLTIKFEIFEEIYVLISKCVSVDSTGKEILDRFSKICYIAYI